MNDRQEMVIRVMTVTPNYPVNESMFQRPWCGFADLL